MRAHTDGHTQQTKEHEIVRWQHISVDVRTFAFVPISYFTIRKEICLHSNGKKTEMLEWSNDFCIFFFSLALVLPIQRLHRIYLVSACLVTRTYIGHAHDYKDYVSNVFEVCTDVNRTCELNRRFVSLGLQSATSEKNKQKKNLRKIKNGEIVVPYDTSWHCVTFNRCVVRRKQLLVRFEQ